MADQEKLKEQIKRQNGEAFKRFFDGSIDGRFWDVVPNLLEVLEFAGDTPQDAKHVYKYLLSTFVKNAPDLPPQGPARPWQEMLASVGYDAYLARTLEEQNAIQKYFILTEELCTFRDPDRYKRCIVINCVKKNADQLKRKDFLGKEEREDEYGTSVISIQINRKTHEISIKNRYNHGLKKENPDNTFYSNPDNIIPGLNMALKQAFNIDFELPTIKLPDNYSLDKKGRILKIWGIKDEVDFGKNAYLKDGVITKINTDYQILFGDMILDTKTKEFSSPCISSQPMVDRWNEALKGKTFKITKDKKNKTKSVYVDNKLLMTLSADGSEIFELNYPGKELLPNAFLAHVHKLNAPNLQTIASETFSSIGEVNAPDGTVIKGDIAFWGHHNIKHLPDLSKYIVDGNFHCADNQLTDLVGAPKEVTGVFHVENNKLTSLKGAPRKVGGAFNCERNLLTTLEGGPQEVGWSMYCSYNQLTDLKGAPIKIGDNLICDHNQISTLEGCPESCYGIDLSHNQLCSLKGAPQKVRGIFNCTDNRLRTLEGAPQEVSGDFNCSYNPLIDLRGGPQKVGRDFVCTNCQLTSLEGSPQEIRFSFDCSENLLTNLVGAPQNVGFDFKCRSNKLTTLEGAPQKVGNKFSCWGNPLTNWDYVPQTVGGKVSGPDHLPPYEEFQKKQQRAAKTKKSENVYTTLTGKAEHILHQNSGWSAVFDQAKTQAVRVCRNIREYTNRLFKKSNDR